MTNKYLQTLTDANNKLNEKLKLSTAKEYSKDWDKNRLSDWFDDKYRIYIPFVKTKIDEEYYEEVFNEVDAEFYDTNYEIKDFAKGVAYDIKNKRDVKIGKVLSKLKVDSDVLNAYSKFMAEVSKLNSNSYLVAISRHPYDIAGMSTDRRWTSCKDLKGGENKCYVIDEVHVALIAYLIKKSDKNINNPIGRILISQYINAKGQPLYVPQEVVYSDGGGIWTYSFIDTVSQWLDQKQKNIYGKFKFNPFQYEDSLGDDITRQNPKNLPEWVLKTENNYAKYGRINSDKEFEWNGGKWSGDWIDGNFESGEFDEGVWHTGVFEGSTFKGVWKDGQFDNKYGDFIGGEWFDGTFNGDDWRGNVWHNGTFIGDTFKKGIWKNGEWRGRVFGNKAIWETGVWNNGRFEGTWKDGTWKDGTWVGIKWITGWIYDPSKEGNYKKDAKWRSNSFVKTDMSPKDYFDPGYSVETATIAIERLKDKKNTLRTTIKKLKNYLKNFKSSKPYKELEAELEEVEGLIDDKKDQIATMENEIHKYESELEDFAYPASREDEEKNDELESMIDDLTTDLSKMEDELEDYIHDKKEIENRIKEFETKIEEDIGDLRTDIENISNKIEQYKESLKNMENNEDEDEDEDMDVMDLVKKYDKN